MMIKSNSCIMVIQVLVIMGFACFAQGEAKKWTLKPINGNVKGWQEGANWQHNAGNPLPDQGAKWTLGYQTGQEPALESEIKLLIPGRTDNNYTMAWVSEKDSGTHLYRGNRLYAGCPNGVHVGPATMLAFSSSEKGNYTVDLKGLLLIQIPDAGAAKLIIYTLNAKGEKPKVLDVIETEIGEGDPGKKIAWVKNVQLEKGGLLCFRIQTHNPGPGNGGIAKLDIENLVISK